MSDTPKNCIEIDDFIAELEKDPKMKVSLDRARKRLKARIAKGEKLFTTSEWVIITDPETGEIVDSFVTPEQ